MAHTFTPEVEQQLQQLADALTPKLQHKAPTRALTDFELKHHFNITTDAEGQPLKPGVLYRATEAPAINHLRRLRKAYHRGGQVAVEQYLEQNKRPTPTAAADATPEAPETPTAAACGQDCATCGAYARACQAYEAGAVAA